MAKKVDLLAKAAGTRWVGRVCTVCRWLERFTSVAKLSPGGVGIDLGIEGWFRSAETLGLAHRPARWITQNGQFVTPLFVYSMYRGFSPVRLLLIGETDALEEFSDPFQLRIGGPGASE